MFFLATVTIIRILQLLQRGVGTKSKAPHIEIY